MALKKEVKTLIIGAGVTGLGAATRFNQQGYDDWLILEGASCSGGLSGTDVTPEGFLFDRGGHIIFSHFEYFDQLVDAAIGKGEDAWKQHVRKSFVWIRNQYVPYPFQMNLRKLPPEDLILCLKGLIESHIKRHFKQLTPPTTFDEWIVNIFGEGIANIFMRPYNLKVWAIEPKFMQCQWLGDRVATVDVQKCISNIFTDTDDITWGPNATFRYPRLGGTGAIWRGVANLLPQGKILYNHKVNAVDIEKKIATCSNGKMFKYENLITTMPVDIFMRMIGQGDRGQKLFHSSTHIIGIGVRGKCPHGDLMWVYYPEDKCNFNRATVFSNYSPSNIPAKDVHLPTKRCAAKSYKTFDRGPQPGPYWSLMLEINESQYRHIEHSQVIEDALQGCLNAKLLKPDSEIVTIHHRFLFYGYPAPTLERNGELENIIPWLQERNIWSRGRFGTWKYEVSNQDHSLMLGVEAADNIMTGAEEMTLNHPDDVNAMNTPVNRLQYTCK